MRGIVGFKGFGFLGKAYCGWEQNKMVKEAELGVLIQDVSVKDEITPTTGLTLSRYSLRYYLRLSNSLLSLFISTITLVTFQKSCLERTKRFQGVR
jgi:hypothetical protein